MKIKLRGIVVAFAMLPASAFGQERLTGDNSSVAQTAFTGDSSAEVVGDLALESVGDLSPQLQLAPLDLPPIAGPAIASPSDRIAAQPMRHVAGDLAPVATADGILPPAPGQPIAPPAIGSQSVGDLGPSFKEIVAGQILMPVFPGTPDAAEPSATPGIQATVVGDLKIPHAAPEIGPAPRIAPAPMPTPLAETSVVDLDQASRDRIEASLKERESQRSQAASTDNMTAVEIDDLVTGPEVKIATLTQAEETEAAEEAEAASPSDVAAPPAPIAEAATEPPVSPIIASSGDKGPACDVSCESSRTLLPNLCTREGWIRGELLFSWMKERNSPPLVVSNDAGALPQIGVAGARTELGDPLDTTFSTGILLEWGRYRDECHGFSGRFRYIGGNGDGVVLSGNQNQADRSYGIPFLDGGANDAVIVSQQGLTSGTVDVLYKSSLLMAEAISHYRYQGGSSGQIDLTAGYTFAAFNDSVRIRTTTTEINDGTLPRTDHSDSFNAKNRFHGMQLGMTSLKHYQKWSLRSMAKVHFGYNQQTVEINGQTTDFLANAPVANFNAGILADENQGVLQRDAFTWMPELDIDLEYHYRRNLDLTLGYTFLLLDDVAIAGEHIDPNVSPTPPGAADVVPAGFPLHSTTHWVQSINIGAIYHY